MVRFKTKLGAVPVILAAACVPGLPVVTVPIVIEGVAPVGPASPVAPAGPVGPVGPVAPVAPIGPVEPFIYAQH